MQRSLHAGIMRIGDVQGCISTSGILNFGLLSSKVGDDIEVYADTCGVICNFSKVRGRQRRLCVTFILGTECRARLLQ